MASPDSYTASDDRTGQERLRGESARLRDVTAGSRDVAADARDRLAGRREEALLAIEDSRDSGDSTIRDLLTTSSLVRGHAAADRADAASDRRGAAADRVRAGADSGQARADLHHAQFDSLTGVYARELGHIMLQHEIDRSRRSGDPFVLGFIDVDGLKAVNDCGGHAAGDVLLQDVVHVISARLRSYDAVVRVGGDEFLCGFSNTGLDAAGRRATDIREAVAEIRTVVNGAAGVASISVGLALLDAGDTLEALTARADADMYTQKHR
jgi:diguanylate cyclase (GGDEF)-like protein